MVAAEKQIADLIELLNNFRAQVTSASDNSHLIIDCEEPEFIRHPTQMLDLEHWAPLTQRLAEREYANRRLREKFLNKDLFGEPSWDILVDLFICSLTGRQVSVSSVATASCVPATTALRYIEDLCDRGLIERKASIEDRRVSYLTLTAETRQAIASYFIERENRDRVAVGRKPLEKYGVQREAA